MAKKKSRNVNIKVYKNPKKELPEKGSKEFYMRGVRKLGKDIDQTKNVLETFTPTGPAKKAIKNIIKIKKEKKTIENLKNKTKAKYSALKESANSNNPMRTERVFRTGNVKYRNPEGAIEFYGDKGSKKGLAEKAMNKRLDRIDENPEMFKNLKGGGKVKLALRGGGRAYGKNS